MRKFLIAATALTALLYSCAKEEIKRTETEMKNASLKIRFANLATNTKALDGSEATQAATLKNAMVFIMGSANDILSWHYFSNNDIANPYSKALPTTTSATCVWIFCNLGDSSAYATIFGACHNLMQLQRVAGKVENINNGFNTNDGLGIWMVGTHAGTLKFQTNGSLLEAKADVSLSLIPSRIDVTVNNLMSNYKENLPGLGYEAFPKSLQLKDVSIMYSAAGNYLFPTISATDTSFIPKYATPDYYAAGLDPSKPEFKISSTNMKGIPVNQATKSSNLFADWDAFKSATNSKLFEKTFYALPADTAAAGKNAEEVTLLIRAEHSTHRTSSAPGVRDSIQSIYFPVTFNHSDVVGRRLGNGQHYTITVDLKGNAETTGGGSTNPHVPVLNAFVTVKVNSGKWDQITAVKKVFQ